MGGWTRAAPTLYPHQWSWDSGFIAIGLAHLDTARAARELTLLFRRQWRTGKVPHIVFNPLAPPESYFPGPEHWISAGVFPDAPPAPPYTSALCQPPIHAVGALRIWEVAKEKGEEDEKTALSFLREIYPGMLRWHRYLLTDRDPEESGLVTIYHPWESGTDNSPRWDEALEAVEIGVMASYMRRDLAHVDDPSERPTNKDYARYIWLVEMIKRARCDEGEIYKNHPFRVKDALMSAILVFANESLLEIADVIEAPDEDRERIENWIRRGRSGLDGCWDGELGLCLDYDVRWSRHLRHRTVAGFAPLISGGISVERRARLLETLDSSYFSGASGLRHPPLPPSTSPSERRFHPRSYWRGPVWPVINWLLWRSLLREGEGGRAAEVRREALAQMGAGGFAEYFEPFTGEPLGSDDQSWTAAVALDWIEA